MPDDQSAESGGHGRQFALIGACAVSVVVLAVAAVIGVHSWRDTAAHSGPVVVGPAPATSSSSSMASSVAGPSSFVASDPAFSAAPIVSAAPVSSPPSQPSPTPSASRHASPTARSVAGDGPLNLKVSIAASPTQVVLGQQTHITVTIVNAGGTFERPVEMSFGGEDPSDNFGDATPPCSTVYESVSCPITDLRSGHKTTFTFTFIPGPFPAMGHFDDHISAVFEYTNSYGQPQQSPQYFGDVLLFDATASPPLASGAPSDTSSPAAPTPAAPSSTTSASSTG